MTSSSYGTIKQGYSAEKIKQAASGRWLEILPAIGISYELLDGRGHPCPKCGGEDRFAAFSDVSVTGGVICRKCFNKANADGLAAIKWFDGCSFPEAIAIVAEFLGIEECRSCEAPESATSTTKTKPEISIVAAVSLSKKMPEEAFRKFGAVAASRKGESVARVPVYDQKGEAHSHFDLTPDGKGWFKTGKGNSGLFFPGRVPTFGETWLNLAGAFKTNRTITHCGPECFNAVGNWCMLSMTELLPHQA